jgi:hypothetical protein
MTDFDLKKAKAIETLTKLPKELSGLIAEYAASRLSIKHSHLRLTCNAYKKFIDLMNTKRLASWNNFDPILRFNGNSSGPITECQIAYMPPDDFHFRLARDNIEGKSPVLVLMLYVPGVKQRIQIRTYLEENSLDPTSFDSSSDMRHGFYIHCTTRSAAKQIVGMLERDSTSLELESLEKLRKIVAHFPQSAPN